MNIFSFVYLAVFLLAGFCIARRALPQAGLSVSIPLGCGFGVSLLAFVSACFAVVLGFRLPALLLAAAVVAALAVWLARHGTPFTRVPDPDAAALWACVLPLAVVTLYLLHTHVLHLVDGSYHTGQSCYGDMAMHLGFIKNIAVTGKLPPVYPLLGGEHRFGYPFLCETVSSVFLVLGADARTAYLLPMLAAFTSVYGMMWQLARQVLGSAGKACLAATSVILLALVLICLACGVYTLVCRPRTKAVLAPWGWFALVCGVVWLVEMWNTVFAQSLDGQHMLRLHLNWINGQDDGTLKDNYFWFYIKNIGLVYLLLIPAFFHAKLKQRWLYGGGLAILVLAEFVVFQPNNYDNNKLLYIWHLLGCLLVASLLMDWFSKVRAIPWRALGLAACCFAGMFGSVLTVGREALSDYRQWSADDMALADHIDENAGSDALFLTSDSHLTPVFALAGRRILCGSGSYVYYHGMDYSAEYNAMRALYETPDEDTLAAWDIGYAVFDSSVYAKFAADESWYAARYDVWYENAACHVYKIK